MWKFVGGMLDRVLAVLGALLFSQFPAFTLQYTHHLAGRVAELKKQVHLLEQQALHFHLTLPEYVAKFSGSADPIHSTQGEFLHQLVHRYTDLQFALSSLLQAGPFSRSFVFFQYFDWELVSGTVTHFTPAITFSLESTFFGLLGLLCGHLIYRLLSVSVRSFSPIKA